MGAQARQRLVRLAFYLSELRVPFAQKSCQPLSHQRGVAGILNKDHWRFKVAAALSRRECLRTRTFLAKTAKAQAKRPGVEAGARHQSLDGHAPQVPARL